MSDALSDRIKARTYTPAYREKVFYTWYNNNRLPIIQLRKVMETDDRGKKPSLVDLHRWRDEDYWEEKADELDQKAIVVMDTDAIQKRVEMMKQHAEIGREMTNKGRDYLKDKGLDSGTEAIRAIVEGTKLERENTGFEGFFAKIATASDDEIKKELEKFTVKRGDVLIEGEAHDVQEEPES